jgi:hypothetical protein
LTAVHFFRTAEDFSINGLIPEGGFKAFTKSILRGVARLNISGFNTNARKGIT